MFLITLPVHILIILWGVKSIDKLTIHSSSETIGYPVAVVQESLIDANGNVVGPFNQEDLAVIEISTDPLLYNTRIESEALRYSLSLLHLLQVAGFNVSTITIYHDWYITATVLDTIRILYTIHTDSDTLVSSLQSMLSAFTIEGVTLEEIDFRFDKPIVRCKGTCPKNALSQE